MSAALGWGLVGFALVVILALDAWLVLKGRQSMTKAFMRAIVTRPFIPFLIGFGTGYVSGHLTWPGEECFRQIIEDVIR